MATVHFTSNLRRHVDCPSMVVTASTVRDALHQVFAANERLETYVLDDQAAVRKHMRILVDGVAITDLARQSEYVNSDSEIWIMQALSGG